MSIEHYNQTQILERHSAEQPIPFWRQLRWTLVVAFVLITALSLMVVVTLILNRVNTQIQNQVIRQLESIAELKGDQIVWWLENSRATLELLIMNTEIKQQVEMLTEQSSTAKTAALFEQNPANDILADMVTAQDFFHDFFVYDNDGRVIAASNKTQIGKLVTSQPYFADSLNKAVVQPPYYELGRGELTMLILEPILTQPDGQALAILAGRLSLNTLGYVMTDRTGLQNSGETYLVSPENNYLVTPSRFAGEGYIMQRAYRSLGIDQALHRIDGAGIYPNYQEPPVSVIGVYRWLPDLQVALVAEINEAEALSLFAQIRNFSLLVAAGAVVIAMLTGLYIASRISRPITALTQAARQFARGDLSQQVTINQQHEVRLLSLAFNQMAAQIRELIINLEERVLDRTKRLEEIATIAEHLITIQNLNMLLDEIVAQVQARFGYYHIQFYRLDDKREQLFIATGTGEAGRKLVEIGHQIGLQAKTSLVAQAARTQEIVTVGNVHVSPDWLPNDLLPETNSEMAVPIILAGETVGVLDVQDSSIDAFDEGDINLMRSLASLVAAAIRNTRYFEEVQATLAELRLTQTRYAQDAWQKRSQTTGNLRHLYSQTAMMIDQHLENVVSRTQMLATTATKPALVSVKETGGAALVAPIRIRGASIGGVQIHASDPALLEDEDNQIIIAAVMEQLGQTAENLRLFEETRKRVDFVRTVSDITQKIREAPSLEKMLEVATRELKQHLSATHIKLELGMDQSLEGNLESGTASSTNGRDIVAEEAS